MVWFRIFDIVKQKNLYNILDSQTSFKSIMFTLFKNHVKHFKVKFSCILEVIMGCVGLSFDQHEPKIFFKKAWTSQDKLYFSLLLAYLNIPCHTIFDIRLHPIPFSMSAYFPPHFPRQNLHNLDVKLDIRFWYHF